MLLQEPLIPVPPGTPLGQESVYDVVLSAAKVTPPRASVPNKVSIIYSPGQNVHEMSCESGSNCAVSCKITRIYLCAFA